MTRSCCTSEVLGVPTLTVHRGLGILLDPMGATGNRGPLVMCGVSGCLLSHWSETRIANCICEEATKPRSNACARLLNWPAAGTCLVAPGCFILFPPGPAACSLRQPAAQAAARRQAAAPTVVTSLATVVVDVKQQQGRGEQGSMSNNNKATRQRRTRQAGRQQSSRR
jgi:hypothetical protein